MKRHRITVQIDEVDRRALDGLVWEHKYSSLSHAVRTALEQFLTKNHKPE